MTPDGSESWDDEIELRKDPWRVKVGDQIFEFVPELDSDRFLRAYRKIHEVRRSAMQATSTNGNKDEDDSLISADRLEKLIMANREYLAMLMLPASAKEFRGSSLPGRVVTLMAQKVMEYYGTDRPTGPSNDSSPGSSTAGKRSTARSRSKG